MNGNIIMQLTKAYKLGELHQTCFTERVCAGSNLPYFHGKDVREGTSVFK